MLPSIWIATHAPWWIVMIATICITTGLLYLIRWKTEGVIYDVAFSSCPGDASLALYCGLVAGMCQHELPKGVHTEAWYHITVAILALVVGIAIQYFGLKNGKESNSWNNLPAQWFHNLFIVPVLSYAVVSTLPVAWHSTNLPLATSAFGCALLWLILFAIDAAEGSLDPYKNPRMLEATKK